MVISPARRLEGLADSRSFNPCLPYPGWTVGTTVKAPAAGPKTSDPQGFQAGLLEPRLRPQLLALKFQFLKASSWIVGTTVKAPAAGPKNSDPQGFQAGLAFWLEDC